MTIKNKDIYTNIIEKQKKKIEINYNYLQINHFSKN